MYAYTVNAQMHLFLLSECTSAFRTLWARGLPVFYGRKKPAHGRALSYARRLTGVHAPPEHMAEDADLLILDILEAVVLVRVLIAIETAQANPGRQAVELFHPQLAIVIDGIQVAIDDVANAALARIHPNRRAVAQHRQHTVATHCHAFGLVELHTVVAKAALAEPQAGLLAFLDDESS